MSTTKNTPPPCPLLPVHQQILKDRAIPIEFAVSHGIRSVDLGERKKLEERNKLSRAWPHLPMPPVTGILIPYPKTLDGIARFRVRSDMASYTKPGPEQATHQGEEVVPVPKYICQANVSVVPYIIDEVFKVDGLKAIVHDLNARGIPSPRSGERGTGSWAPSAVRSMLRNERYLGKVIWNRENEGVYRGGTKLREARPKAQWVTVERPELRIVSDELWEAVRARFKAKTRMGRKTSTGPIPRYLLTGFSRCSKCGGPIQATNGKQGKEIVKVYSCAYHRERGTCDVTTRRPVPVMDEAVVHYIETQLLQEQVIVGALAEVRRRLTHRVGQPSALPELERRARQLQGEIGKLGEAILTTDQPLDTVTQMLSNREVQLREINARIAAHKALPSVVKMETLRLEKEARARAADLQGMLRRSPSEARKALEKLLTGPMMFTPIDTPEGRRFQVTGEAGLGGVLGFSIEGVPNGIRRRARGNERQRYATIRNVR